MISAPLPLHPQMTTWPLALVLPMPFPLFMTVVTSFDAMAPLTKATRLMPAICTR
jgi:hypothetical protein